MKRLRADDSAGSRVKVGHRQAITVLTNPLGRVTLGAFVFWIHKVDAELG